MNYISAYTDNEKTEIFNLDHVLSITPHTGANRAFSKIVMAPNLYWYVETNSIRFIDCRNALFSAIGCANPYGEEENK